MFETMTRGLRGGCEKVVVAARDTASYVASKTGELLGHEEGVVAQEGLARSEAAQATGKIPATEAAIRLGGLELKPGRALASAVKHVDGKLVATDGAAIAYRTSQPATPVKAVVVMMQGTYGKAAYFDGMGEALGRSGIKSYSITSRVEVPGDHQQHARDLQAVVALAQKENPGAPVTVMGSSLGAMIALEWSARFNRQHLPVVALSPVVLSKFQGPTELAKVVGGVASDRVAQCTVNTPMSKGVPITSNPAAPSYHIDKPEDLTIPAGIFSNVLRMSTDVAVRGWKMDGPILVAMAGDDQVAVNLATKGFTSLIRSEDKTVRTFPGLAHDLSQEYHNPNLVAALRDWILQRR